MTSLIALVVALSLLINEIHILYDPRILRNKFFTSNLVYLLSICLILRQIDFFPFLGTRKCYLLCLILEIPTSIVQLEGFLYYLWKPIQDYLLYNADSILVNLSEERGLEWLVCHLCCGQSNCTTIFAALVLKFLSFVVLFSVCAYLRAYLRMWCVLARDKNTWNGFKEDIFTAVGDKK